MAAGRTIVVNRQARYNYEIVETMEAGISLMGTEVKSIREGKANIKESYADIRDGEVFLVGAHISPYTQGNINNHDPLRERKLLLHAREIRRLAGKVAEKGLTLVPLRLYLKGRRIKLELGLGRGKKLHDKRETIKKRDQEREIAREMERRG
ncbi:MAG TPA: SsrA-binding protein SmpB [Proteobacteria bacterium]|nr:SsrA-binding protein [bacterium BMS3Abin14]HDL52501.1 SsrA-binding protein SmpB [Pseudomonadota bacterium]